MRDVPAAKDRPKFVVRLPEDAKHWLEGEAQRNASSQNSEVVRSIRERMDRQAEPPVLGPTVSTTGA